jgi:hypothetical protein
LVLSCGQITGTIERRVALRLLHLPLLLTQLALLDC